MKPHYQGLEEWYGKGSQKYNPSIHLPLLLKVFGEGNGVAEFCSDANISTKTFENWYKKYPEFSDMYDIALAKGCAIWEKKPLQLCEKGLSLNHNYWLAIMRNRFKFYQSKVKVESEDTTTARMKAAIESLQEGGITPQEFNQIASGLSTESRIKEVDLQKEIVDNLKESNAATKEMKDEALKAYMLVMTGKGKVVENEQI